MSEPADDLRRIPYGRRVRLELVDGTCRTGRLGKVDTGLARLLDEPDPVVLEAIVDVVIEVSTEGPE
jgi:hypothetical protein